MAAITLIKNKSDAAQAVINYINMAETQLNKRVKELHTDNGTEYLNEKLQTALSSRGIIHTTTAPYTPEQNPIAERYSAWHSQID